MKVLTGKINFKSYGTKNYSKEGTCYTLTEVDSMTIRIKGKGTFAIKEELKKEGYRYSQDGWSLRTYDENYYEICKKFEGKSVSIYYELNDKPNSFRVISENELPEHLQYLKNL